MTEELVESEAGAPRASELPHLQSLDEARGWVGAKLDEIGGATAGRVEGVLVDVDSREPSWLVIRVGRFGHLSAIPYEVAAGGVGHVWVPYPRDGLRGAPEVDPSAGMGFRREIQLCDHFEIPAGTGRRAQIEGREDDSFTSVPG